jgi:hypothetical protein
VAGILGLEKSTGLTSAGPASPVIINKNKMAQVLLFILRIDF